MTFLPPHGCDFAIYSRRKISACRSWARERDAGPQVHSFSHCAPPPQTSRPTGERAREREVNDPGGVRAAVPTSHCSLTHYTRHLAHTHRHGPTDLTESSALFVWLLRLRFAHGKAPDMLCNGKEFLFDALENVDTICFGQYINSRGSLPCRFFPTFIPCVGWDIKWMGVLFLFRIKCAFIYQKEKECSFMWKYHLSNFLMLILNS